MKRLKYLPVILTTVFIFYSLVVNVIGNDLFDVLIQQIQYKSPDSLVLGRDRSDLEGINVSFVARVLAPPRVSPANNDFRTLLRGSTSWTCYVQDTSNGIFGGMVIRQGNRGSQTELDLVDTGTIIRVSGVVQEFGSTGGGSYSNMLTRIAIDTSSNYTIDILESGNNTKRPIPIPVNVNDFVSGDYPSSGTINYVDGEKYEGMYVEIRNVITSGGLGFRQPWSIIDENGNRMYIRDFSNFFSTQTSDDTLRPWTHPSPGTFVEYVRGVIINANNEGTFGSQLPYVLVPIYPNDLSIGNAPPQLSNPLRNPGVPTPTDSVAISVTATDPSNSSVLTDMKVFYRFDRGAYLNKNMTLISGNVYSTKIPPTSLNTLVEYFFRAEDNSSNVKILPSDTSKSTFFYKVRLNDSMSIQEVQFCPNKSGKSGYEGINVRGIEGIVTVDTSDIPGINFSSQGGNQTAPRRVYLQNGQGPNSGIWISGNPTDVLKKGYRVRVYGTVEENSSVTRIKVASSSGIYILSIGNPLPSPEIISTSQILNAAQDGDQSVEIWESVLLRLNTPVIMNCINAADGIACTSNDPLRDTIFRRNFGEILVSDNSSINARIELQDGNHTYTNNWDGLNNPPQPGYTLLKKNNIISYLEGVLYYSNGNYKLTPRLNPDFGDITLGGEQIDVESFSVGDTGSVFYNESTIIPSGIVRNNNPVSLATFFVSRKISPGNYLSTKSISNLAPVSNLKIEFDPWSFNSGVTYTVRDSVYILNDVNAGNNIKTGMLIPFVGTYSVSLQQDFSETVFPPKGWTRSGPGSQYWKRDSTVSGYGKGNGSAFYNFFNANTNIPYQYLVSPEFSPTEVQSKLKYDHAYAPYTTGTDSITIETSTNNGVSFSILVRLYGNASATGEFAMNTAPASVNEFTPDSSQWMTKEWTIPVGTNKIRFRAKSGYSNNFYLDNIEIKSLQTYTQLNIISSPEGLYNGSTLNLSDTIKTFLRNITSPYSLVDSAKATLNTNTLTAACIFPMLVSGTYYIQITHRNSLESWSQSGGHSILNGTSSTYDFTISRSKTYGNNSVLVGTKYCFYSGDVNQDGTIDIGDGSLVDNNAFNFASGYLPTDINGDGVVDVADAVFVDNNGFNFVSKVTP